MLAGGVIHYTEFFGIKETKICGRNHHLCVGYFDEYFSGDCSLFIYFGCQEENFTTTLDREQFLQYISLHRVRENFTRTIGEN